MERGKHLTKKLRDTARKRVYDEIFDTEFQSNWRYKVDRFCLLTCFKFGQIKTYLPNFQYIKSYLNQSVPEKNKKTLARNKRKNISNHGPEEKEKSFLGKKERKDQPRPT